MKNATFAIIVVNNQTSTRKVNRYQGCTNHLSGYKDLIVLIFCSLSTIYSLRLNLFYSTSAVLTYFKYWFDLTLYHYTDSLDASRECEFIRIRTSHLKYHHDSTDERACLCYAHRWRISKTNQCSNLKSQTPQLPNRLM